MRPVRDLAALAAFGGGLAAWSWGKWTDLWVDYGAELDLARRLSSGEALYRDIVYKNGPLSPYVNAALFRVFGDSLGTLTAANLAVVALLAALLYRLGWRAFGRAGAAVAAAVFLGVFAFAQYTWFGNFNFVAPYSHCQTHGLLLGLAAVLCWADWLSTRRPWGAAAGGLLVGAAFLTKLELFVPAAAAAALAVAAAALRDRALPRAGAAGLALALLPPAAAVAALGAGALGNLTAPVDPLGNPFYVAGMGLDDPWGNAASLAGGAAVLAGLAALAAWFQRRAGTAWEESPPRLAAVFLAFAALGAALPLRQADAAVAPAVYLLAAVSAWGLLWRAERAEERLWSVYAALLFAKIVLAPRFWHYGFALAMPGAALAAAWLVGRAPELARARWGGGRVLQAALAGLVAAVVAAHLAWSRSFYALKTYRLAGAASSVLTFGPETDQRGLLLNLFLEAAAPRLPPGATLVALPEGAMLNYLLGAKNPTPYLCFLPEDIRLAGGEEAVLARLEAAPPDFVALLFRDASEFGAGRFGASERWGGRILDWVRRRYARIGRVGADPALEGRFGLTLWRRL